MNPCVAKEYIESALKIKTKTGEIRPFRLNAAQNRLYAEAKKQWEAGKPVRLIVLKARQLGFSTLTEGLIFHACATRKNVNALIVAHREDATANLFRMSRLFYDELPEPLKPMLKTVNSTELVFENPARSKGASPGLRSRLRCATAGGRGIGRSDTLQFVHLSEYAFWPEGAEGKAATLSGILQAVPSLPGTMVVIESTANGYEDFKERWDAAAAGENDFTAVFFPWFDNPEYTLSPVPGTAWTPEERELTERWGLTEGQLTWRRWCIANNCGGDINMFRQEYPATPEEAFLHSGTGVFDNGLITARLSAVPEPVKRGRFEFGMRSPECGIDPLTASRSFPKGDAENGEKVPRWTEEENGPVKLWEEPVKGRPYVLGGDTAGEGSDYFTAYVLDNVTGYQVASLRHRYSEPEYVRQICALGQYYNNALVGLETNFSTYPVQKLSELNYVNQYRREREDTYTHQIRPSFGFRTDRQTRPRAIANLVEIFSAHPQWLRDKELLTEMLSFCYNEEHRPEALSGKHDDLVMSAAIAYAIRHQQSMTEEAPEKKKQEKLIDRLNREKGRRRMR